MNKGTFGTFVDIHKPFCMKILLINGPNLNMLDKREPEFYGSESFANILVWLEKSFPLLQIEYYQSNHEGDLIDKIQQANLYKGLVINAAAYSHYSYAIQDALRLAKIPKVEVHLSNIYARESFRQHSVISTVVDGVISGFGKHSYYLAMAWLQDTLAQ